MDTREPGGYTKNRETLEETTRARTRVGSLMVKSASLGADIEDGINAFAKRHRGSSTSRFNTALRAFTILDIISRHEGALWHT